MQHNQHVTVEAFPLSCHEGDCEHNDYGIEQEPKPCPPLQTTVCVDCMDAKGAGRSEDGWEDLPLAPWPHPGAGGNAS